MTNVLSINQILLNIISQLAVFTCGNSCVLCMRKQSLPCSE